LGMLLFMVFAGLHLLAVLPENTVFISLAGDFGRYPTLATTLGWLGLAAGSVGLYYMVRCYRIPARPFWDHWQTGASFVGSAMTLGGLILGLLGVPALLLAGSAVDQAITVAVALMLAGCVLEGMGLVRHAQVMDAANNEGSASHYIQCTVFGKSYRLRNGLLGLNIVLSVAVLVLNGLSGYAAPLLTLAPLLLVSVLSVALIGRCLFYVLVIPTTMPGAFFWKNKDFEEHARDIGLAHMPQVGVVYDRH